MDDEPITTAGTPKAVRELEMEAIAAYRAKYPDGTLWHELDHSTRVVWVTYTEIRRSLPEPAATPKEHPPMPHSRDGGGE